MRAILTVVLCLLLVAVLARPAQAQQNFYVDASTGNDENPGSSAETPFMTIKRGLVAADAVAQPEVVTIYVKPGTYRERVTVKRENTILKSLGSTINCDAAGRLIEILNPATIELPDAVNNPDVDVKPGTTTPTGLQRIHRNPVTILASNVEFTGFVVDGRNIYRQDFRTAGIFARGTRYQTGGEAGEDALIEGVRVRKNIVKRVRNVAISFESASGVADGNRSDGPTTGFFEGVPEFIGVFVSGSDIGTPVVDVLNNVMAGQQLNMCFLAGVFEFGEGASHGAGSLVVRARGNSLSDANSVKGANGFNLQLLYRGTTSGSPAADATLHCVFEDNLLGTSQRVPFHIFAGGQEAPDAVGAIYFKLKGNGYLPEATPPNEMAHLAFNTIFGTYTWNSRIHVNDVNGFLTDGDRFYTFDLGPCDHNDKLVVSGLGGGGRAFPSVWPCDDPGF